MLGFLANWKLIAGGALLAVLVAVLVAFWWSWSARGDAIDRLEARNAVLSSQLDTATQVNGELRATMEGERQRYRRTLETLDETERRSRSRQDELNRIREATRDAEDGPVADSLRIVLDRLRNRTAPPDNEGGDSAAANPAATD